MNKLYFDKALNTFFDDSIHDSIPVDAIEITTEQHQAMLEHFNSGGRIELDDDGFVFIQAAPDAYHVWNDATGTWETSDELQAQKQADIEAAKLAEISSLLAQAAQKVSEYQDLKDFADTDEEMMAGETGYNSWRQYRATLLKYQKGLIAEMPVKPE